MTITLTRLPDINTDLQLKETAYRDYGRFAVLRDMGFWFGDLHSSHPATTKTGWYWAVDKAGDLYVSPRGAVIDGEKLFTERKDILAWLIEELVRKRVIRKPVRLVCIGKSEE